MAGALSAVTIGSAQRALADVKSSFVPSFEVVVTSVGGVAMFTTYPGMGACEAVPLTNCFEFRDVLPGPTGLQPCFEIPEMGSSPAIDEVYDGLTVPEVIVGGVCANLIPEIDHNQAMEIPADTEEPIVPSNTGGSGQTGSTVPRHAANGSLHTLMTPPVFDPGPLPQPVCQLGPCSIETFG